MTLNHFPEKAPPRWVKPGTLYVVGTPIGNLHDITFRAVQVLKEVDLIAAEDTRKARILLDFYDIPGKVISYFEGNEAKRTQELQQLLQQNQAIALISEAGLPGISDPGWRLIHHLTEQGIPLDVIPGPNAALTALILSGFCTDQFFFAGFLPRRGKERAQLIAEMASGKASLILYESPHRIHATLLDLSAQLGTRRAAVVREMTKIHQEVISGTLTELADKFAEQKVRGEITLVVERAAEEAVLDADNLEAQIADRLAQGESPRDIALALSQAGKRRVYEMALTLGHKK